MAYARAASSISPGPQSTAPCLALRPLVEHDVSGPRIGAAVALVLDDVAQALHRADPTKMDVGRGAPGLVANEALLAHGMESAIHQRPAQCGR